MALAIVDREDHELCFDKLDEICPYYTDLIDEGKKSIVLAAFRRELLRCRSQDKPATSE